MLLLWDNKLFSSNKHVLSYSNSCKCKFFPSYFSQLLEEHGPLDMSNKMFSEEYEFFPEETRQILEKAGGLKSFLLGCPRFVVIDNCIALKKVALRLKKKRKKKHIKAKVEEISRTGEYLRVKLPLNPSAREFQPDASSKPLSDLSSEPASEDVKPKPESADSPRLTCEDVKPKLESASSSGSVSEDNKPKGISADSPKPVSEDANHKQVSSNSPKPIPEDVKPTYWAQSHLVTGYCTYLPFQGFDITQTPPTYINVLPTLSQYTSIYTPLPSISSEYPLQRSIPVVPSFVASDRADKNAAACFQGHNFSADNDSGNQIASKTQILEDSLGISVKSQSSPGDADPAPSKADELCKNSNNSREVHPGSTNLVTDGPRTQVVAIQVSFMEKNVLMVKLRNYWLYNDF
jgi:E3 ubiquitin-protein ligase TTC3